MSANVQIYNDDFATRDDEWLDVWQPSEGDAASVRLFTGIKRPMYCIVKKVIGNCCVIYVPPSAPSSDHWFRAYPEGEYVIDERFLFPQ